jgi:hypothetical protein
MGEVSSGIRRSACTATFIATGSSSALPAVIIEVAADGLPDAHEEISRLTEAGLVCMASASDALGHAPGWMVLAHRGLDRVDVLMREGNLQVFFGGACIMRDDWFESVERIGYCALLAGSIGLNGGPDASSDPELVTRMVEAAAAAGLMAGAMVPVYLPGYEPPRNAPVWPGTVTYQPRRSGGAARRPLGLSLVLAAEDEFGEVAGIVRAEARGMSYEWVRHRLAVELLLRGQLMPPRIVDQVAEGIMFKGHGPRARHAGRASLATSWLTVRSLAAFILRRPLPHWHILGMHIIETSRWGPCLDVAVDPWVGDLLAMGESDEITVWLGMPGKDARTTDPDDIEVYRGDYRLGVLSDKAGIYRMILMEPRHADTHVLTDAIRSREVDGSWRLCIRPPEAHPI